MNKHNIFNSYYTTTYHLKHPIQFLKEFRNKIHCAYQRIDKGWCDNDIVNLNEYYLQLFTGTLTELLQRQRDFQKLFNVDNIEDTTFIQQLEHTIDLFESRLAQCQSDLTPCAQLNHSNLHAGLRNIEILFDDLWENYNDYAIGSTNTDNV